MDKLKLMRLADSQEEDAIDYFDIPEEDKTPVTPEEIKRKYKEFYSDIKIDISEDW